MTHGFKGSESVDLGRCNDPYCTGHTKRFIVCSCGWKEQTFSTENVEQKVQWLTHVVHALQQVAV